MPLSGSAQDGKQQRIADLAYEAEMAHDVGACPEAQTVVDRDVCLNDARVETYKNYTQFFDALREALIQSSPERCQCAGAGRHGSGVGEISRDCMRCNGQGL